MQSTFELDATWEAEHYLDGAERERIEKTISMIPSGINNLLDVGTGNAAFLAVLEERLAISQIEGLEYSEAGIRNKLCKAPVRQGSADRLPFNKFDFDLVTCLEVLEHLPQPVFRNAVQEIQRVAGKYILVSVPYQENRVNVTCPQCNCKFNPNTHVRSFYKRDIENLFADFELTFLESFGNKREMYFGKYRNVAKQVFMGKKFPKQAVCPLCQYTLASNEMKKSVTMKSGSNKLSLIKRLFFYNAPRWYIALYKRKGI
ncbi:MAG: hypothetical protein RL138_939 [Bacteroidota bacterium]|jgi:ubiquinone/menaquinone biosynthesis C-methylase UbiE|nr:class I SAM-dependent methyltransferase [Chitinophagales bacterium]